MNRVALEELVTPKEEEARLEGLLYFGDSKVNCFATGEVDSLCESLRSFGGAGLDEIEGKMGFGGSWLPKDTIAIRAKFEELDLEAGLLDSIVSDNEELSKEDQ